MIRLVWMYHNILDLYGDKGNILVFQQRCAKRGIDLEVVTCGVGEEMDMCSADIVFIGGGADLEQGVMYADLCGRKQNMLDALAQGTSMLLICGGYQLLGQYYQDSDGKRLEGMGIFDYYTASDSVTRCIGNIIVDAKLHDTVYRFVGFENHGGQTYNVSKPFAKVVYGHGNTVQDGVEGYFDGQVLGTYMHGPLLPKNPEIADYFITRACLRHTPDFVLTPLDDTLSQKARQSIIARFCKE